MGSGASMCRLLEAKPRSEKSIDYYKETKKRLEGKSVHLV